jgi:hypothetical protein
MEANITMGESSLLKIATLQTRQGSAATLIVSFGPVFQGIKTGHFTWDGQLLHGTIDGQPIVPFTMLRDLAITNTLTYVDGTPIHVAGIPEIVEALTESL